MNAKAEQKERSHESNPPIRARLVREKGISGAGVADVMKGAALTSAGSTRNFSSKDELVEETLRRTGATLRERLFARLDEKSEADAPKPSSSGISRPSTATAARPGARCQRWSAMSVPLRRNTGG